MRNSWGVDLTGGLVFHTIIRPTASYTVYIGHWSAYENPTYDLHAGDCFIVILLQCNMWGGERALESGSCVKDGV